MSIMDATRRTTTDEHDFYQTLPCQINVLCALVDFSRKKIIDAGAGKQVIANHIKKHFPRTAVITSEKNSENIKSELAEFDFDNPAAIVKSDKFPPSVYGDFLSVWRPFDIVASNPPYSLKDEFITHSLEIADDVFMLFPLQVLNYIEFCEEWLDTPKYMGRITMYPKVILNPQGEYIQGGNTGYAWFHWSNKALPSPNKYEYFVDIRKYKNYVRKSSDKPIIITGDVYANRQRSLVEGRKKGNAWSWIREKIIGRK